MAVVNQIYKTAIHLETTFQHLREPANGLHNSDSFYFKKEKTVIERGKHISDPKFWKEFHQSITWHNSLELLSLSCLCRTWVTRLLFSVGQWFSHLNVYQSQESLLKQIAGSHPAELLLLQVWDGAKNLHFWVVLVLQVKGAAHF